MKILYVISEILRKSKSLVDMTNTVSEKILFKDIIYLSDVYAHMWAHVFIRCSHIAYAYMTFLFLSQSEYCMRFNVTLKVVCLYFRYVGNLAVTKDAYILLLCSVNLISPLHEHNNALGAVSIRKTVLPGMAIPMLKIRRPNGRLIFNMEIAIRR